MPPPLLILRAQIFKLVIWFTLVFFEHGSEMQLATALVVNVLNLCVHLAIKPMGGVDGNLLNALQAGTLVTTTYVLSLSRAASTLPLQNPPTRLHSRRFVNFGAFAMNYLEVSKDFARNNGNEERVKQLDEHIYAIQVLMQARL